jgi:hypothetical protein
MGSGSTEMDLSGRIVVLGEIIYLNMDLLVSGVMIDPSVSLYA